MIFENSPSTNTLSLPIYRCYFKKNIGNLYIVKEIAENSPVFSFGNKLWLVLRKHGPVPVNFLVHA